MNWAEPSVALSVTWAWFSRLMASPKATRTMWFLVFSPNGVVTGLDNSNLCVKADDPAPLASFQNAPNSTGPRCPGSQCRFQCASTEQASRVLTVVPSEVGAEPWKLRHIVTKLFLVSIAA